MRFDAGSVLASYRIVGLLGTGGMGEVYRARDPKLNRDVAIKVLPEEFAKDPERVARFHREAQSVAALNHPNIAAIYELAETEGTRFLVLELVEGETLAERIRRGPLPIDEAMAVAKQIAEALEAAHEKGVVHRDLKPANVKITPEGKVKVLDFGLAKMMAPPAAGDGSFQGLTQSPTLSLAGTVPGVIMGTAAYMSPEQAKGFDADHRSDIFSFGSVLYEMLTGRKAFDGDSISDVLASVLKTEADLNTLPPKLNPRIVELLRRCLEKNPRHRWHAAADVRVEIESLLNRNAVLEAPARTVTPWKRAIPVAVGVVLSASLTAVGIWTFKPSPPLQVTRFPILLPEGQQFSAAQGHVVDISPDGSQIAYMANTRFFIRSMSDLEPRFIPGTEFPGGVGSPVFSPDGRHLVFGSYDRTLHKVAVAGGGVVTLCQLEDYPSGIHWSEYGIVFGYGSRGIMRVSENGGEPEVLVSLKEGEFARAPQVLPGGKAVLFTVANSLEAFWDNAQIVVHSLESGEHSTIIDAGYDARYVPTGHIVYALGTTLYAVPFDLERLTVTGGLTPVVEGVRRGGQNGRSQFAISDTGSLVYVPGSGINRAQNDLARTDRKGVAEPLKLPPVSGETFPRISPDGTRVAYSTDDGKDAVIWVHNLSSTSFPLKLTYEGRNRFPIWTADGRRIAFQSDREGDPAIFWQSADGSGIAERLTKPEKGASHVPDAWHPTQDIFLFSETRAQIVSLWTYSLQDQKAAPFGDVHSTTATNAAFSPDGAWVAYQAPDPAAGNSGVFIQPFPATGAKYQLPKIRDDHHPLWSPDGNEIFYVPGATLLSVVAVSTRPRVEFGVPAPVPNGGGFIGRGPAAWRPFDIFPGGKQFIGVMPYEQSQTGTPGARIQVVLNWFEELKRLAPIP